MGAGRATGGHYARRHVAVEDAQDVVAETFLQARRQWDAVPQTADRLVGRCRRKVIGNHRRAAPSGYVDVFDDGVRTRPVVLPEPPELEQAVT